MTPQDKIEAIDRRAAELMPPLSPIGQLIMVYDKRIIDAVLQSEDGISDTGVLL